MLGVDLCAGYRKNFDIDVFHESHAAVFGTTFRWRPAENTEIIPFWSFVNGGARQIVPGVYTDGTVQLPLFRTQNLGTQEWTTWGWHQTTFGAIVKSAVADHWQLAAGVFHSAERDPLGYQPYLTLVTPYTADSQVDVVPPFSASSTSGELRLTREFANGAHEERLQLAIRGVRSIGTSGAMPCSTSAPFPSPARQPLRSLPGGIFRPRATTPRDSSILG